MSDELLKQVAQYGIAGLSLYFLWLNIKEQITYLKGRVDKVETKVDDCEKDRKALWERLLNEDK